MDSMGTDLTVVNAARVSPNKYHDTWNLGKPDNQSDTHLLNFLFEMDHGSPLEHGVITFRVKVPLFVRSQWERHRIASYNEQSGRWTPFEPEFYIQAGDKEIPAPWEAPYALY